MHCSETCLQSLDLLCVLRSFGLLILSILFLQSGVDKITDWQGNLGWLKGHFAKSPFKNVVPVILGILTLQEVLTGVLCLGGLIVYLVTGQTLTAIIGLIIGLTAFAALFLGQRLAKDYPGAASLVPYMIFNGAALFLFL